MADTEAFDAALIDVRTGLTILAAFFVITWGLRFLDGVFFGNYLNRHYCIRPREYFSIFRLLLSPMLHGNRQHLFFNTFPLLLFGGLAMLSGLQQFWLVTAVIILIDGLGIWFFGTGGTGHVGASGLILGYFGFILLRGFLTANYPLIIIAVIIAWLYRWAFRLVISRQPGISSSGHFFGFMAGLVAAWLLASLP
jgi:membrane associated rhomboid family serine protease